MVKPTISIFDSVEELADSFARRIAESVSLIPGNQYFSIALSGGSTPKAIFKTISEKYNDKIDWSKVKIFWGDERCVLPSSEESNFKTANESLLKNITIPGYNIFRIEGEKDPGMESLRYAELIKKHLPIINNIPSFDLVMLGLGEDGHTASIFPYNIQLFHSDQLFEVSLHPVSRQTRITATGRLINNAKDVTFLVTGESKAEMIARIIEKKTGWKDLPASFVIPENGKLTWMLDKKAASLINYRS